MADDRKDPVTVLDNGGIQIDRTKLGPEQVAQIIGVLLASGNLLRYLQANRQTASLPAILAQTLDCDQRDDIDGLLQATARLLRYVNGRAGMISTPPEAPSGYTPEIDGLPEALEACAGLARAYPAQCLNAEPDEERLRAQARRLRHVGGLSTLYQQAGDKARANLGALAREAAPQVRRFAQVLEPALPGNEDIATAASPLYRYLRESAERALATRQRLQRERAEITAEVTEALYDKARAEARKEIRSKLDERLAAALDENG